MSSFHHCHNHNIVGREYVGGGSGGDVGRGFGGVGGGSDGDYVGGGCGGDCVSVGGGSGGGDVGSDCGGVSVGGGSGGGHLGKVVISISAHWASIYGRYEFMHAGQFAM